MGREVNRQKAQLLPTKDEPWSLNLVLESHYNDFVQGFKLMDT